MTDLQGRRVVLTRTPEGCREWAEIVRAHHGEPVLLPCLRTVLLEGPGLGARARALLRAARWVSFASATAVTALRRHVDTLAPTLRVAAVGPRTAQAARTAFGRCDLIAETGTAAGLAEQLAHALRLERTAAAPPPPRSGSPGGAAATAPADGEAIVVCVGAAGGREDIEERLAAAGVLARRLELYRTVWQPQPPAPKPLPLSADAVLLASPSAARGLVARARPSPDTRVITIGPTTTATARDLGLRVAAEAKRRTLEAMLEEIR